MNTTSFKTEEAKYILAMKILIPIGIIVLCISLFSQWNYHQGEKPDTMLGTGNANQSLTWGVGGLDDVLGEDG